ncbi:MAG: hypothetical protein FWC43_04045 [Planctomycetaceae bacterium]|nr:hypothetical protein [Planctomycetaceae bacterium]
MSLATTIAKSVVAELNEHNFLLPFEAAFSVKPGFELSELETLRVIVVPKTLELETVTRSSSKYLVSVDVGIMQRIGKMTPEEAVETLGDLVDEIVEFLKTKTLEEFPAAQCVGVANDPIYVPDHLTQSRTFTSVVNVKYTLISD